MQGLADSAGNDRLAAAGLAGCYEAAHARLAVEYLDTVRRRLVLLAAGKLPPLAARSQYAADKSYVATTAGLCDGLARTIKACQDSGEPHKKRVHRAWSHDKTQGDAP